MEENKEAITPDDNDSKKVELIIVNSDGTEYIPSNDKRSPFDIVMDTLELIDTSDLARNTTDKIREAMDQMALSDKFSELAQLISERAGIISGRKSLSDEAEKFLANKLNLPYENAAFEATKSIGSLFESTENFDFDKPESDGFEMGYHLSMLHFPSPQERLADEIAESNRINRELLEELRAQRLSSNQAKIYEKRKKSKFQIRSIKGILEFIAYREYIRQTKRLCIDWTDNPFGNQRRVDIKTAERIADHYGVEIKIQWGVVDYNPEHYVEKILQDWPALRQYWDSIKAKEDWDN